jgi:hypothetical protein
VRSKNGQQVPNCAQPNNENEIDRQITFRLNVCQCCDHDTAIRQCERSDGVLIEFVGLIVDLLYPPFYLLAKRLNLLRVCNEIATLKKVRILGTLKISDRGSIAWRQIRSKTCELGFSNSD